ncbi:MAG: PhnD/SsuA/transferrin family substrate-binding protein [Candidatus Giovannonibacteria bacterium]|nr:PhnD/SsuA/transferrin family substrate-binding protein [Candidatus Giovannonibacteria bacterium]
MENSKIKLVILGIVVVLALIFWLAPPDFLKLKPQPVKVQYQVGAGGHSELRAQVIKKYGIDKKYGVDFEIVSADPGELERRMVSGESYLADVSPFVVLGAKQKNISLRILSPSLLFNDDLIVLKNSSATSLGDLKGKKFGTRPKVTAAYSATAIVFKSAGFDIAKDFRLLFGNLIQTADAVERGEADFSSVGYPNVAPLLASGKFKSIGTLGDIWSGKEDGLPLPFVAVVANGDWFEKNKGTALGAVRAILEGGRLIQERPGVISELTDYLNKNNYNTPQIKSLLEANIPSLLFANWGDKEIKAFERYFARAKQLNIIPPDAPIESYIVKPSELGI